MLIIRLRQQGAKNRQTYRLVVTDEKNPLDGGYVEKLGWYNPHAAEQQDLHMDVARVQYWIEQGAQVSDRVKSLVKRAAPEIVQKLSARQVARRTKARLRRQKKQA